MITSARPDMVYIKNQEIVLVELTIPYNSPESLTNAKLRKQSKDNYQQLLRDFDQFGKHATVITIEIGSLGHYLLSCSKLFARNFSSLCTKLEVQDIFNSATKTAISASQIIL